MQAIKKVLSNKEEKSPSGHFTVDPADETSNNSRHHHDSRSTISPTSTTTGGGNNLSGATSTGAGAGNGAIGSGTGVASAAAATATGAAGSQHTRSQGADSEHYTQREHAPEPAHQQPREHSIVDKDTAQAAEHDHKHLAPVTHHKHQVHETEEVTRQRDIDRHVHHVQHHVQPVYDTQHEAEKHHEVVHPTTEIYEKHVSTDQDKAALAGLSRDKDTKEHVEKDRVVVDKGEAVSENVHHHVHHVVQPKIMRDTHEHHTIHTTIPTHQTVHEAPIVHQSVQHEPMSIKDFQAGGGDLKSNLTSHNVGVLHDNDNECQRQVDGPADKLLEKLHLSEHREHVTQQPTTANTSGRAF
ncbi:hypothetical protein OIO90_005569 [Microbotryomycetes sp. JL221]|nr:hypothetical protein OIO90_005569 [Microbotryomycetes sp. JL221]